jgi:hypothetical protein
MYLGYTCALFKMCIRIQLNKTLSSILWFFLDKNTGLN